MHGITSTADQSQSGPAALANKTAPAAHASQADTELNEKLPIQLKLSVGAANDPLEHEADSMADKVMRMPETSFIQRKCSCGEYDDEHVRLKPLSSQVTPFVQAKGDGASTVSSSVSNRIQSSMGAGSPMQNDTKNFMESRFGADFSDVKIHNGGESAELNRSLNARAFTVSNNIYFNSGQYQPETDSGKHLLAHELTHVVQQNNNIRPKLIQRQQARAHPAQHRAQRRCCYTGTPTTHREIHLNIGLNAIRIYRRAGTTVTNTQFNNLILGPSTNSRIRCQMYSVQGMQRLSGQGLINFVNYDGDFGFHSNFWDHQHDGHPTRIPGTQSHGCARLNDADAASVHRGDSESFFASVSRGDCVRVYSSGAWEQPSFLSCNRGAPCPEPGHGAAPHHAPAPQHVHHPAPHHAPAPQPAHVPHDFPNA